MWDDACGWARRRLSLLAGGELAGADRRKVERHLLGCPGCRDRLESLKQSLFALGTLSSGAIPSPDAPSLWPALARQIREERRPTVPFWSRPAPWIGAAMAASGLVVAGLTASRAGHPARPSPSLATNPAPSPPPHAPAPRRTSPAVSEVNSLPAVADSATSRRPEGETVAQAPVANSPANPARGNGNPAPAPGVRMPTEPTH